MQISKIKMNKKGAESEPRTAVVPMVIAVIVLVIVLIGVSWSLFGDILFAKNLANLNETKPDPTKSIETFGYKFSEDRVQYYNGAEWLDFPSGDIIEVNGKRIDKDRIRMTFVNSDYFAKPHLDTIGNFGVYTYLPTKATEAGFLKALWDSFSGSVAGVYQGSIDYWKTKLGLKVNSANEIIEKGIVYIIYKQTNGNDIGICILRTNNDFSCAGDWLSKNQGTQTQMKEAGIEFRKKIYKNPFKTAYHKGNTLMEPYVCPKFVITQTGAYLSVDLSKEVQATETCLV